jgi:hypothetical protein
MTFKVEGSKFNVWIGALGLSQKYDEKSEFFRRHCRGSGNPDIFEFLDSGSRWLSPACPE